MNICDKCGREGVSRKGKFGNFLGCPSYPRCKGKIVKFTAPRPTGPRPVVVGSPEQIDVWNAITSAVSHVVVDALAGTGKSFTCREAMHKLPASDRVLYLAFNKAIADEFRADAPENCTVSTLNAIGYRIVKDSFKSLRTVTNDKTADIISELWKPETTEQIEVQKMVENATEKLVSLCQGYLIDGTDAAVLAELAVKHEVEMTSDIQEIVYPLVPAVLKADRERTAVVSFADQLWFPVIMNLPAPKFDVIFVDEAQDLNPCQHKLVMMLLAPGGRVVVVGDENQAIYGFRGSDVDSIRNLSTMLETTGLPVKRLPLTVTRRCGKNIVTAAQQFVPTIQALPDAAAGEVIESDTKRAESLYSVGDMVVCRTNAPLAGVAYMLIKRGVKAIIRGRDIGQGMISLIKRLRPDGVSDLLVKLDKWERQECEKYADTRRGAQICENIKDRADCIRVLSEDCGNLSEVIARIDDVFANFEADGKPKNAVVLSSIHRAKGSGKRPGFLVTA